LKRMWWSSKAAGRLRGVVKERRKGRDEAKMLNGNASLSRC